MAPAHRAAPGSPTIRAGYGSKTNSRPSSAMATPLPHPLAGITYPPIEHVPQPNLPSGCSTAPLIPTDHSHIQPPRASQRAETFPATMRSLPQRAGSTTVPSREALQPRRIAHGAIWEPCRAAASVKTCSTCSRPSLYPSKSSQPTPPSPTKTIPISSVEQSLTSMRAPATSVSAASRWTAAVAHRRHFCPTRHIIWSKPKLRRVISPGVTASPFPPAMTAGMSSSMSSPVPLPCASQRSMPRQGQALKSARHLPALSSPASHSLPRAGRTPSRRMRTAGQHLPTSPWAPLPSMSRELPRAICPPMKPGATPSVPISSETRASLSSSAASPTSPSLSTSRFQSSRTAAIAMGLV